MKLWEHIKKQMLKHPEQTVCENNAAMTYEELCIYAEHFANKLIDPRYAILCRSELAAAMALLSCIAAGKTAVPLPYRYGKETYDKIIDQSQPSAIIHDLENELTIHNMHTPFKENDLTPTVILFTSGSTGTPKGIMLSETNLLSNIESILSYFPICADDTILISRPLYHSSVLTGEFLISLCAGAKIVFSSEPFQPLNLIRLIKKHNVTTLGSTPTLLSVLSKFIRSSDEHSVKLLSISGECMTAGMAKNIRQSFPKAQIYCGYGLSEASPRVAYLPAGLFDHTPTAAGIPCQGVACRIVTDNGIFAKTNEVGDLLVKGENVMQGYLNDTIRTNAVVKNGWLHTGDLACWGDDGLLYIKGRKDDMIIRAGMNIYPAEIENILSRDKRVEDVTACGFSDGSTQQISLTVSGKFQNEEDVMALCRAKLPSYMLPAKIKLCEKIERLSGGKKKRHTIFL